MGNRVHKKGWNEIEVILWQHATLALPFGFLLKSLQARICTVIYITEILSTVINQNKHKNKHSENYLQRYLLSLSI